VGAAAVQERDDLSLIGNAIELSAELFGCRGYLTQSERGGKNLDEKHIHGVGTIVHEPRSKSFPSSLDASRTRSAECG